MAGGRSTPAERSAEPHSGAAAGGLLSCEACATLQRPPPGWRAGSLSCTTCTSPLERTTGRSLDLALACSSATLLLLLPANLLPFLKTYLLGGSRQSHLVSSVTSMVADGWPEMALAIALAVIVLPVLRFGLLTTVLGCLRFGIRPPWLGRAFRYANTLQTWAMLDVFLLGFLVAYARLATSIVVEIGLGAQCFIAAGLLSLFTRAALDKSAVWRLIAPEERLAPGETVLTCLGCDQILPTACEGRACPRCASRLRRRKPNALWGAVALLLAAVLLYIPANTFAIATLPINGRPISYNVLVGVIDLAQFKLYALAALVFTASFAIPTLKLAGLSWCIVSVLRRSKRRLRPKTRLYELVEEIGRWSMVDPFVIACFVPVMDYNTLIYGRAEPAAPAFTAVVILTMLASRVFDPRLMWDAARSPA